MNALATPTLEKPASTPQLACIVLAIDGSPDALAAGIATASLAHQSGAAVVVVHAWDDHAARYTGVVPVPAVTGRLVRVFEGFAEDLVDDAVRRLRAATSGRVEGHIARGHAADAVLEAAGRVGADLIVVGSRGRGSVGRLVIGSVAERLVHHAGVPVLVVRGGADAWPPGSVLAAVDGSPESWHAAQLGELVALAEDLPLSVLHVVVPEAEASMTMHDMTFGDAITGLGDQFESQAGTVGAALRGAGSAQVRVGDPAAMIMLEAGAQPPPPLITMGSHGYGRAHRLALGSVSTKVLHGTRASVLIAPSHGR